MRAVCVTESGLCYRDDFPQPIRGAGEAMIRVALAGICATDLELVKGYMNFRGVLGHEFVGVVEAADDASWIGERVVSTINLPDRSRPAFLEFGVQHDPNREVLGILGHDGVMADFVVVPDKNLHRVPAGVPDRAAVFTEPLAAALRIAEQILIPPSETILVIGPGRLGMLIGRVLSLWGADVVMAGRSDRSLALARRWGLSTKSLSEVAADDYSLVVEATGNPAGLRHALRATKPLGTLVLKSTYAGALNVELTKVVVGELNIVGSRCGPFEPALRLLDRQRIDFESLIDAEYPIASASEAFEQAGQPGVRKVLLQLSDLDETA